MQRIFLIIKHCFWLTPRVFFPLYILHYDFSVIFASFRLLISETIKKYCCSARQVKDRVQNGGLLNYGLVMLDQPSVAQLRPSRLCLVADRPRTSWWMDRVFECMPCIMYHVELLTAGMSWMYWPDQHGNLNNNACYGCMKWSPALTYILEWLMLGFLTWTVGQRIYSLWWLPTLGFSSKI